MLFTSIVSAFYLLNFYVTSAHPTSYPNALPRSGIEEDVALDTQLHLLHKRMEGIPNKVKIEESQSGSSSNVKSTDELLVEAKASVESWGKKVDEVDGEVETNRKKVHFKAAEAHLLSKSLNDQDPYK